jgi:hypothetical protein
MHGNLFALIVTFSFVQILGLDPAIITTTSTSFACAGVALSSATISASSLG